MSDEQSQNPVPQGEVSFTTSGSEVQRRTFTLPAKGPYKRADGKGLKLRTDKMRVGRSEDSGYPYITLPHIAIGSGKKGDGSDDAWIFQMFFCSLEVSAKDGKRNQERGGQLIDFSQAVGQKFEASVANEGISFVQTPKGSKPCINPIKLEAWFKQFDGMILDGLVKIEKGTGGYGDKAKVDYYMVDENGAGSDPFAQGPANAKMPWDNGATPGEAAPDAGTETGSAEAPSGKGNGKKKR